jgi:hypothetical protein
MSSSARSFGALARYLVNGRSGDDPERVAWSTSRNLPTDDPELAGKIMRATAAQNVRVDKPVYHLALSFDPNDAVDRAAMERVADRVIAALKLQEHQILIVSHGDRDHPHMHLLINRVHPETGLVWNRWQDRAIIQLVLREEEQALGLRVVPSRLSARKTEIAETSPTDRELASENATNASRASIARTLESSAQPSTGSRVDQVVAQLKTYERISELNRDHFPAEIEASSARARVSQLEEAIDRAQRTREVFERSLNEVYHYPAKAQEQFAATAAERGIEEAVRVMREHPEQLGALLRVEKSRAFGFVHAADDAQARRTAVTAAIAGRDSFEASTALHGATRTAQSRRIDSSVERDIAAIYVEPAKASAAFERIATEHGRGEAVKLVREQPEIIGELRAPASNEPSRLAEQIKRLMRALESKPSRDPAGRLLSPFVDPTRELTASRAHELQAITQEAAIRRELSKTPGANQLERNITALLSQLTPKETRQLQSILTAPQIAVAARLRSALRDVLLGKEAGHEV